MLFSKNVRLEYQWNICCKDILQRYFAKLPNLLEMLSEGSLLIRGLQYQKQQELYNKLYAENTEDKRCEAKQMNVKCIDVISCLC